MYLPPCTTQLGASRKDVCVLLQATVVKKEHVQKGREIMGEERTK